ncbi:MAG: 2-C-methyl-D-erythritol 2,4-cyclodiphosphate synthase [Gemmataceae bacterium]
MRVGIGHDLHRLQPGRRLILGGLEIPYARGLVGHSDGDVVLHALVDALLGAAGLGDIGDAFPDDDPRFADADSSQFLRTTLARLAALGYRVSNVDLTIFAQEPRLGSHKEAMRRHLAALMGLVPNAVNVKAKTGEKVGVIGRGEAIACQAVVLIRQVEHDAAHLQHPHAPERSV